MIRIVIALLLIINQCSAANFTPTDYGAVGDCVTDDTTALLAMRTAIVAAQGAGTEAMTVSLRGKCYMYTNNRWLWGIRNLYLLGGGARLLNVASFTTFGGPAAYPLVLNRTTFETTNVTPIASFTEITSAQTFLINTANSGASSVTLKNIGDAVNFSIGLWVAVNSYDQQMQTDPSGYPPNARFVDYAQVNSINGAVIGLSAPLVHTHSDSFPEFPNYIIGRARILPLDGFSPVAWGNNAYIENVIVLDNPNALRATDSGYSDPNYKFHNNVQLSGYIATNVNNLFAAQVIISSGAITNIINSHLFATIPDKLVNNLTYTDVVVDNEMAECTGIDAVNFIRGSIGLDSGWMFSSPVTISNGGGTVPGVISWPGLLPTANTAISLSTRGTLPAPLTPSTVYFVASAGLTTGMFSVSATAGGSAINTSSAGSGIHTGTYSGRAGVIQCYPRSLIFNNSTIGSTYNSQNFPPTWNLNGQNPLVGSATNTTFMGGGATSVPISSSPTISLTVDGSAVTTSGAAITMADVTVSANGGFLTCAAPGGQIGYVPMGGGAETIGTITTITGTYTGPNSATITFTGIPTVSTGDAMKCHPTPVGGITLSGNTYLNYGGAPAPP